MVGPYDIKMNMNEWKKIQKPKISTVFTQKIKVKRKPWKSKNIYINSSIILRQFYISHYNKF